MFKRTAYLQKIQASLQTETILFLIGPRQAGKTSLMLSLVEFNLISQEETVFLSMDQFSEHAFSDIDDFLDFITLKSGKRSYLYLLLDEIQCIPNAAILLKGIYDRWKQEGRKTKIICSGSGTLSMFQGIHESLIGRKETLFIYPFSFSEFLAIKGFDLFLFRGEQTSISVINECKKYAQEYMTFGGYPKVVLTDGEQQKYAILRGIYDDYLFRDIALFLKSGEFASFRKFLPLIAEKIGTFVKIDRIVQESGISRRNIEKFLFLLENTLLIRLIPSFARNKSKEVFLHKKLYFLDSGILRILLGASALEAEKGKIVENFVCTELIKQLLPHEELKCYQKKSQSEIDFILENMITGKIIPIEVKSQSTDTIPTIFSSFHSEYKEEIDFYVLFNEQFFKTRPFNDAAVQVIPYIFSGIFRNLMVISEFDTKSQYRGAEK